MPEKVFENFGRDIKRIRDVRCKFGAEAGRRATQEHDEEVIRRRKVMIENFKTLLTGKKESPRELTLKKLDQLITEHPELFFNLKSWHGGVGKYFLDGIATLKELLLEE